MEVRCPKCNRFLAEATGYVRVACVKCGLTVAVTPKVTA